MRSFALSALVAALPLLQGAVAQGSLADVPDCVQTCALQGLGDSGCSLDPACLCSKPEVVAQIATCLESTCSAEDVEVAKSAAQSLCGSAGVELPPTGGETPPSSSAPASSPPAVSTTSAVAPPTDAPYGTPNATTPSATGAGPTGTSPPEFEGAAAIVKASWVGGALAVAGLLFAL
ncbi:MAG: hypothetical protein M1833_003090 [Piccolia ochrophora]|nr:MAG: hypothetical protein M1833_003090 [Piccolia ochrophora]